MRKAVAARGLLLCVWSLLALTVASQQWTKLDMSGDSPPDGRDFHTTIVDDKNQVYFFGGNTGVNGWTLWNDLHVFDIASAQWTRLNPAGSIPTKRMRHSAVYDPKSNAMIVFGGSTIQGIDPPSFFNDLCYYFIDKNEWETNVGYTGTAPAPRSFHVAVNANGVMVIYGGGNTGGIFNDIHLYHIAERRWEKPVVSGIGPADGRSHSSLVYNAKTDEVILFGGLRYHGAEGYSNTLYKFDVGARRWSTPSVSGVLPTPRVGHAAVLLQNTMVIFGGYDSRGKFVNDMAQFDLESHNWETITSSNPPSPRYSLGPIIPKGSSSSFLIFDGYADTLALRTTFFNEVWKWER